MQCILVDRLKVSKCQYIRWTFDMYDRISKKKAEMEIYMSNCDIYICPQFTKYMSQLMYGSRFILPCCNVIFDTYCRCSFRHIFRSASYANELSQTVPLPAKNESEAKPKNNMAAMEEQNSMPHERASDLRDKMEQGSSVQQDLASFWCCWYLSKRWLTSRFNLQRSRSAAGTFPTSSHALQELTSSFNPVGELWRQDQSKAIALSKNTSIC